MKRALLSILLAAAAAAAFPQTTPSTKAHAAVQTVSVSANGEDVRAVVHTLFTQAKKSYVMDPSIHFVLYLSLADMDFDEALQLICKTANLGYELQNGIYFVGKPKPAQPKPATVSAKPGKLAADVLKRRVTTKLEKIDMRDLFRRISEQINVKIEVNAKVPSYKLDAILKNTSLKYALDTICQAANLSYRFTDNLSIEIFMPPSENRVSLRLDAAVKPQ
jgi:type II secretory pathway component GspD/PulD (secretin)